MFPMKSNTHMVVMELVSQQLDEHYKKSGFRRRFKNVTKNPKNVAIDTNGL